MGDVKSVLALAGLREICYTYISSLASCCVLLKLSSLFVSSSEEEHSFAIVIQSNHINIYSTWQTG
jgi:hypothetical protein